MRGMEPNSVDAIVTDPPYGLEFMGKEWDKLELRDLHGNPLRSSEDAFASSLGKQRKGGDPFIGKGIRFVAGRSMQNWHYAWAIEALRVAKPGCHLLAFGGTRTFHRLACAIEDAGWEIRDTLMWVYGSGFPKSHDVSKAIDKAAGAKREVVGTYRISGLTPDRKNFGANDRSGGQGMGFRPGDIPIAAPATDAARQWEGWGTALKPAWEPIIMARKPLEGTVAANVQKWGMGAINVDGCRVGAESHIVHGKEAGKFQPTGGTTIKDYHSVSGRWPANLIHDGSEEVLELFPETKNGSGHPTVKKRQRNKGWCNSSPGEGVDAIDNFGDSGSAARFFYCAHPDRINLLFSRAKHIMDSWKNELANTVDESLSLSNQVAASVLSGAVIVASQGAKQLSDVRGLSTSVTPSELRRISETLITAILCSEKKPSPDQSPDAPFPNGCLVNYAEIPGQTDTIEIMISRWKSDGSAVSATFKITPANSDHGGKDFASRFIYCAKASRAEREAGCEGMALRDGPSDNYGTKAVNLTRNDLGPNEVKKAANVHPCVKPLALMRYLVRLVTPPNGTILDPFMGSGTTGMAAKIEGFGFIGIEKEQEYIEIAERRIEATEWRAR